MKLLNLQLNFIGMDLRIKEILAQRGVTLKEFAQMSGISQSNLSNYLNGNISPTLDTLKKMASFLGIDVVELFKEKDDIEFYAKHDGILYPINKSDILEIISKKQTQK
jgi:transcriptional regulator with XRE-family HTH domain